jgi:hypothetical protein
VKRHSSHLPIVSSQLLRTGIEKGYAARHFSRKHVLA